MTNVEKADSGEAFNNCWVVVANSNSFLYTNVDGVKCDSVDTGDGTETTQGYNKL